MVKNWLKYGYYFIFDGTTKTAKEIEAATIFLETVGYNRENPLLIEVASNEQKSLEVDGGQSAVVGSNSIANKIDKKAEYYNQVLEDNGFSVRLKRIDFEKQSSLTAFSILEGMHTEDSEYIYRDLKEFLIELGYFTRADFETIQTGVFDWIVKGYTVYKGEWPNSEYEKDASTYGSYIRSKKSMDEQRNAEKANGTFVSNGKNISGFKENQPVIAPETGIIEETGAVEETGEGYFKISGSYITIKFKTNNGVDNWKMKIKGINLDSTSISTEVTKGSIIGTTNENNIKIILYDDKDAIIDDIGDYFKLKRKKNNFGSMQDLVEFIWKYEGIADSDPDDGDFYTVLNLSTDIPTIGHGITAYTADIWEKLGYSNYLIKDGSGNLTFVDSPISKDIVDEVSEAFIEEKYELLEKKLEEKGIFDWNNDQKNAITSFIYNTGGGDLDTILDKYKDEGQDAMIQDLLQYTDSVSEANKEGLKNRRVREVEIFLNGKYDLSASELDNAYKQYY